MLFRNVHLWSTFSLRNTLHVPWIHLVRTELEGLSKGTGGGAARNWVKLSIKISKHNSILIGAVSVGLSGGSPGFPGNCANPRLTKLGL